MHVNDIKIEKLTKDDLHTLITWAAQEGWNPGKYDADVFWNTDPDGFYGFKIANQLIAGGAIVSYEGAFGFMGLFIVHPDYRGSGIGHKLWHQRKKMLLARLKENAAIGMDGVLAMQGYYQKGGFVMAYRDERYAFAGKSYLFSENVGNIGPADFDAIATFDKIHFGFQRRQFLQQWLFMPESKAIQYTRNKAIVGYAVMRKALEGYKIGPLFAQDVGIAEELLKSCLDFAGEAKVFLDIPTTNPHAVQLVKKFDGQYIFECARMYCGQPPDHPIQNIYGLTSFELG